MTTYRLEVTTRTSGHFNYTAKLYAPEGYEVASSYTDTLWGAKWWARRQARKHTRQVARHEFEVRVR